MNEKSKERLAGIGIALALFMIVVLGFGTLTVSAQRDNLRDELAKALARENACLMQRTSAP